MGACHTQTLRGKSLMQALRKILLLVRPYWGIIVLAALCSVVVSGLNGALAWLVKPAVDKIFVTRDSHYLLLVCFGVMGAFLLRGVFRFLQSYLMWSAGAKVVRDMQNRLYSRLLRLPMSYFNNESTGAVVSKIVNDAGVVQDLLAYTVKDLFVESGTVIVLIFVAMTRRWDLTLLSITVLPAAFYFVSRLSKRLKKVSARTQEKISGLTEILAESFSGSRIIKSFCREGEEIERFTHKNQDFYREKMRALRIKEASTLLMDFVGGFGIAFVLLYGGNLVIKNSITAGDFFSLLTAIFMIFTPAKRLASAHNSLQQVLAPIERIDKLLAEKVEEEGGMPLGGFRTEIAFEGVSFRYSAADSKALENININVRKGELIAIVGRSGAGKTTLVDLIPRFYSPSEGRILIDGADISRVTLTSLRSLIGIVSQDIILFNDTVRANIAYGRLDASEEDIIKAAKAAYADDFIREFSEGYDTMIGEGGVRLSGGQRQRLSIARAILKNPDILILDEATSALDTASEIMVQKALENLMHDRTAFVIAHRLSTVRMANRIIVMDKGKIIESGTHEELMLSKGAYEKLYNMQFNDSTFDKAERESKCLN